MESQKNLNKVSLCLSKIENMEKHSWREKEAQEEGSGFYQVENYFKTFIKDSEFNSESKKIKDEGVRIRDKEHLFYYKTFRKFYSPPFEKSRDVNRRCPEWSG